MKPERGAALLIVMLALLLVSALTVAVLDTSMVETAIAANHAAAQQALFTADAGLERALLDLLAAPDWTAVLSGGVRSSFLDSGSGMLPDGRVLDLAALTRQQQAESDAFYGAGANRAVWRLYAYGPLAALAPGGLVTAGDFLLVWVADDLAETDDDALRDGNGIVLLRADGHGEAGARRAVEAAVRRRVVPSPEPPFTSTRVLWWREVR